VNDFSLVYPFSMFIVEAQKEEIKVVFTEESRFMFRNLPFPLPETLSKHKGKTTTDDSSSASNFSDGKIDSNSFVDSSSYPELASKYVQGTSIFLPAINNPFAQDITAPKKEDDFYGFFKDLFEQFFSSFGLPYTIDQQEYLEGTFDRPDFKIYRQIGDEKILVMIVEVKQNSKTTLGESQALGYSVKYLNHDKERFFILSMVCSLEQFAFFCAFRRDKSVTFVQLTEYDRFSFGSNALGLLKLLYILELPWPMYGSMLVNEDGVLSVWKEKKILGSGSSADVYEFEDSESNPKAIKFFNLNYPNHFLMEVYIYQCLQMHDVSLKMDWYRGDRLMICTNGVKNEIEITLVTEDAVRQLYESLRVFHSETNCIHKDIYYKNILQSSDGKLFLNDFGLADFQNIESPIEGNSFFASDRILLHEKDKIIYDISDDLYSLTFSLIYLKNVTFFSKIFKEIDFRNKRGIFSGRTKGINDLLKNNKENIINALDACKKKNYKEIAEYTIKCLF
jgi:hypothetical protein